MTNREKKYILFVDDDAFIINGYKRSVDEYNAEWVTFFAASGKEALDLLSTQKIDVLVTDLKMPGMDGIELLEIVCEEYPAIIRLILSGNMEETRALLSARYAHQLIGKPCNTQKLHEIIENVYQLRDVLIDSNVLNQITGLKRIPSLPSLYFSLTEELNSEDPDPKVVGNIISQDVSMTAKILQLVNSAFFGLPREIVNAQLATTILGTNTIKALVLGSHVFSEYKNYDSRGFSIEDLWAHSLIVGNLSKMFAGALGLDTNLQGQAQLAGMMHDVGKLLELEIRDFDPNFDFGSQKKNLLHEYNTLGTSHAELGAYLLALWGIPKTVVEAVAYHHSPAKLSPEKFGVVSAVHFANGLFNKEKSLRPEVKIHDFFDMRYLEKLNLSKLLNSWSLFTRTLMHDAGILKF